MKTPRTPLYNNHDAPTTKPAQANAGLWYDKFCNQWCRNPIKHGLEAWTLEPFKNKGDDKTSSPKQDWIDTVTSKLCGNKDQLEQAVSRLTQLLEYHSQAPLFYKLESDFVTGLGREHPVENGFAWHHSLGTPYLPGSSVKGMVRAWAEVWTDTAKEAIQKIFGSDDPKNPHVGSVIFLDALPIKSVQLKADIMTPHYSPYYQDKDAKTPPADWHSPIPIPFLVVERDQGFVFGILPRGKDEQSQKDCEWVKGWLEKALCWTGAGAKTAVGYGRFALLEESKTKSSSASNNIVIESELEKLLKEFKQVSKNSLKERTQGFVDKLIKLDFSKDEKQKAAKEMKEFLEKANVPKLNKLNAYKQLERLGKD